VAIRSKGPPWFLFRKLSCHEETAEIGNQATTDNNILPSIWFPYLPPVSLVSVTTQLRMKILYGVKGTILWVVMPYRSAEVPLCFGGPYRLQLQGRKINPARSTRQAERTTELYPRQWFPNFLT
jgi:hypothetical protein